MHRLFKLNDDLNLAGFDLVNKTGKANHLKIIEIIKKHAAKWIAEDYQAMCDRETNRSLQGH